MITVVTSCSAKGWQEYGRNFVTSFAQHWPRSVELHLVSEDLPADQPLKDGVAGAAQFHNLWEISPAAKKFHMRHFASTRANGKEGRVGDVGWEKSNSKGGYNFRYDAYRFSKKVFAIEAVAPALTGRLFWIDADVVTFAPVHIGLLERLLPAGAALSYLEREAYHSECGFVGYNLEHPITREFIARFAHQYASESVFHLREWHDSWVFDWVRKTLGVPGYAIPHQSRKHPFVNSEIGRFMDHKKGNRKARGTPATELVTNRDVPYWRGQRA